MKEQAEREAGGRPRGFAHKHTITQPRGHTLWQVATQRAKDSQGKKTKRFRYNRRTTPTAIQVAIDHAFMGTYVDRFRPNDPPEACVDSDTAHHSTSSTHARASTQPGTEPTSYSYSTTPSASPMSLARRRRTKSAYWTLYRKVARSHVPNPVHGKRHPRSRIEELPRGSSPRRPFQTFGI